MSPRPAQYQKVAPRSIDDLLWGVVWAADLLLRTPIGVYNTWDSTVFRVRSKRLQRALARLHEQVNP